MYRLITQQMLAVAAGGAVGSTLRFTISRWVEMLVPHRDYPWGIFVVNVLGCFAMGVLFVILTERSVLGPVWRAGLLIGVLGGFTTFSSFSIDTITLMQSGDYSAAVWNVVLTVTVCLLATLAGLWLTRGLI